MNHVAATGYTLSQASAITGLPLGAVHKAIEHKLVRPTRVRQAGRLSQRLISRSQMLYLRMEARGVKLLPLSTRRIVARAINRNPEIDVMALSEGSIVFIECRSARKEVDSGLRFLTRAMRMVESDPELMQGTPVYKGTRISIESIADMLSQGATVEEIIEGYPVLTPDKVTLAPLYIQSFPRKGRPPVRPWAKNEPVRTSRQRVAG